MKKADSKTFIALGLILAGFLSALALALIASHKTNYLVANQPMAIGHIVDNNDFRIEKAALWNGSNQYLTDQFSITGAVVTRFIGENELLLADMFSNQINGAQYRTIPVSVLAADLPLNLIPGQSVDLYQVIAPNDLEPAKTPKLIISNIRVLTIDRKGQNLGNSIFITFAAPEEKVIQILNATRIGRIVIVSTTT